MMMVTALAGRGNFDAARQFIDDARTSGPRHPLRARLWQRELRELQDYINELEKVQR